MLVDCSRSILLPQQQKIAKILKLSSARARRKLNLQLTISEIRQKNKESIKESLLKKQNLHKQFDINLQTEISQQEEEKVKVDIDKSDTASKRDENEEADDEELLWKDMSIIQKILCVI